MVFSVIVPTHNRLELLKRTLESLFRQDFPDYEIIVVNDGSTDGTHEYLMMLASENKIRYIRQQNRGPAVARNAGLKHASGTYVAFTDDDCVVPADWLRRYHNHFASNPVAGIGGASRTGNVHNPCADANDTIVNFLKSALNTGSSDVTFLTTNNAAYRKASLQKVCGFDERFFIGAEERDLNHRLVRRGETLSYDASIVVEHWNDAGFVGFLRHQFDQGKGSFRLYKNARQRTGRLPERIPARVYLRLLLHPFKTKPFLRALIIAMLIVVAQVAVAIGYISAIFTGRMHATSPAPISQTV